MSVDWREVSAATGRGSAAAAAGSRRWRRRPTATDRDAGTGEKSSWGRGRCVVVVSSVEDLARAAPLQQKHSIHTRHSTFAAFKHTTAPKLRFCAPKDELLAASCGINDIFTPLRYVPNGAKRSIWDQRKKCILRTDQPATSIQRPTTRVVSPEIFGNFFRKISGNFRKFIPIFPEISGKFPFFSGKFD